MANSLKSRRSFLQAGIGFPIAANLSGTQAVQSMRALDFSKSEDQVHGAVRMMADSGGARTYSWTTGRIFGQLPGEVATPLFGFEAGGVERFEYLARGVYRRFTGSLLFFKDLASGTTLDTWRNPYNGKTTSPVHMLLGPTEIVLTPKGYLSNQVYAESYAAVEAPPFRWQWGFHGDVIWATRDVLQKSPARVSVEEDPEAATGDFDLVTEFQTYQANRHAFQDPAQTFVPTTMFMTASFDWFPWMLMSSRPGSIVWQSTSRKVQTLEELPQAFVAEAEQRWPLSLLDPERAERRSSVSDYLKARASRREARRAED